MIEVATGLIFDADGKLRIYLRDNKPDIPFPNHWDLFGGHVEDGESPDMALVREIKEELGVDLDEFELFDTYHCLEGDAMPNIKHVYTARICQFADDLTLYEGQRLQAIDLDQRHEFQFANILGRIIDDYVTRIGTTLYRGQTKFR